MSEAVLANEVHLLRLVGDRREVGGLGDHPRLHRQQVAEDARQRHDDVDPRAAEVGERDQLGAAQRRP